MSPAIATKVFRVLCVLAFMTPVISFSQDSLCGKPLPGKLIFSETPEIGQKWHGGIRMNDVLVWDGYWNINNWLTMDLLIAGLPSLGADTSGSKISDHFYALTWKSRPVSLNLADHPYKASLGLKIYRSNFILTSKNATGTFDTLEMNDKSTVLFLTESYSLGKRHDFNLFTSLSFRNNSDATYYIVPGYRFNFGEKWSFAIEYYMTNTMYLPMKVLQFYFSANNYDFENYNRDMYSFMFYGFQYAGRHIRIDLNMINHISFEKPFFPLVGVGWNF